MGNRKAFTLIELLVVIAIIAILAAILFPIFRSAQDAARKATCQNNVKEMLTACALYEGDTNGGVLPGLVNKTGDTGYWVAMNQMWPVLIDRYLKQTKKTGGTDVNLAGVFLCPSRFKSRYNSSPDAGYKQGDEIGAYLQRCYGYNSCYLGGWDPINSKYKYHNTGEVVKPSGTIRLLENWNGHVSVWGSSGLYTQGRGTMFCYPPVAETTLSSPTYCWPPGWHSGSSTVGWYDGHVSSVRCAPFRPGSTGSSGADPYYGIMSKGPTGGDDPYFRLAEPKP